VTCHLVFLSIIDAGDLGEGAAMQKF
jgi:hypothetical protein